MGMAVDGTATGQGSSGATLHATLTTVNPNDIIVVVVTAEQRPTNSIPTVSSVTASGLTFTRRSSTTTMFDLVEIWWAFSTTTLAALSISAAVSNYDDGDIIAFGVSGSGFSGLGSPFNAFESSQSINNGTESVVLTTDASQPTPFVIAIYSDSASVTPSGTLQPAYMSQTASVLNGGATDWEYTYVATGVASGALTSTSVGWTGSTASPNPLMVVDAIVAVAAPTGNFTPGLYGWGPFGGPGAAPGLARFASGRQTLQSTVPPVVVVGKPAFAEGFAAPQQLYALYGVGSAVGQGFTFAKDALSVQGIAAFSSAYANTPSWIVPSIAGFGMGFTMPALSSYISISALSAFGSGYGFGDVQRLAVLSTFGQGFVQPAVLFLSAQGIVPTTGTIPQNPGGTVASMWRWTLVDPAGVLASYVWEINPRQGGFPGLEKVIDQKPTTSPDGPVLLFEGRQKVPSAQISGTFHTEDQFIQLSTWFNLRRPFYVLDDLSNRWTVYITQFQPGRKLSRNYPWKTDYTLTWLVTDVVYGSDPGPGFSTAGGA